MLTRITCFLTISFLFIQLYTSVELSNGYWSGNLTKYSYFLDSERLRLREEARRMFYFGYDNYMKFAFPKDELDPIHCTGRGPDYDNPSNININDVLGDYSLGLLDSLSTLAIMGNSSEFKNAVRLVLDTVSFDKDNNVQVFEATIRVLGSLLSAHLIVKDPLQPFGDMVPKDYDDGLLLLAHDLAGRLLAAFDNATLGIPYPRVNLRKGVLPDCLTETCTAGAGTMLLEFGVLSRLLGDPTYEGMARRAVSALWKRRSPTTGLFGNVIDIHSGQWVGKMSGLGAGLDSFYEYLLKGYIMFGESDDLKKFNEIYRNIQQQMRIGRAKCQEGNGNSPILVNVNMETGKIENYWVDSLHAAFAGVQVLKGDIKEAICTHSFFYAIWKKYKSLPERFNWYNKQPEVHFYPLRPELIESTYLLYQATHHPFYLHVGKEILEDLEKHARAKCGYATIHNVMDKTLEDRMESFFLSETSKYLFLLFDQENHVNQDASNYVFSTEGHIFRLDTRFRKKPWEITPSSGVKIAQGKSPVTVSRGRYNDSHWCDTFKKYRFHPLPLDPKYLQQVEVDVGLHD